MRKNLYNKPRIGLIDQGSIFNGGIAEEYEGCDVFGIIITTRCDIAHNKVPTYHYLPIVHFRDWLCRDFWKIFSRRLKKDYYAKAGSLLKNNKQSAEILNYSNLVNVLEGAGNFFEKEKDLKQFQEYLLVIIEIEERESRSLSISEALKFISHNRKIASSIIKEVISNQNNLFYFLESWNSSEEFHVILLREINKLPLKIGEEIAKGLLVSQIPDRLKKKTDLDFSEELVFCETNIGSPYIEHLIQMFFQNFGRIGVEDHDPEISKEVENIINSFKID